MGPCKSFSNNTDLKNIKEINILSASLHLIEVTNCSKILSSVLSNERGINFLLRLTKGFVA